jgi:hypothetical protein
MPDRSGIDDVRIELLGPFTGGHAAARLAGDLDVGDEVQRRRQCLAERWMVVDDEHAHGYFLSVPEVHCGRGGPPSRQWFRPVLVRT